MEKEDEEELKRKLSEVLKIKDKLEKEVQKNRAINERLLKRKNELERKLEKKG